jgi:hypothetical protein
VGRMTTSCGDGLALSRAPLMQEREVFSEAAPEGP